MLARGDTWWWWFVVPGIGVRKRKISRARDSSDKSSPYCCCYSLMFASVDALLFGKGIVNASTTLAYNTNIIQVVIDVINHHHRPWQRQRQQPPPPPPPDSTTTGARYVSDASWALGIFLFLTSTPGTTNGQHHGTTSTTQRHCQPRRPRRPTPPQ